MLNHVRMNKMSKVLHDLGFEENRIVGSHIRFYNPSFNALILFPIINEELQLPHLRMIERTLEEKGVLSREEFESRLNGKSGKKRLNHAKPLREQKTSFRMTHPCSSAGTRKSEISAPRCARHIPNLFPLSASGESANRFPLHSVFNHSNQLPAMRKVMKKWTVQDRYGNTIYLTEERWQHILESRPELESFSELFSETIRLGHRKQDSLIPNEYRYFRQYDELLPDNNHLVVVVVFRTRIDETGNCVPNNFVVTGWAKHITPKRRNI